MATNDNPHLDTLAGLLAKIVARELRGKQVTHSDPNPIDESDLEDPAGSRGTKESDDL